MAGIQKIAKKVILEELEENLHVEAVEYVIFWALEYYAGRNEGTLGEAVASAIIERIREEENNYQSNNN